MDDLIESGASEIVEKSTESIGDLNDLVQWMTVNFGGTIQLRQALQQAAFLLCCDVIAQDTAKATLRLRERTSPTTSRIVMPNEHPVAAFLATEPSRWHTWFEAKEMMALWTCLTQNAFAVIRRSRFGEVEELLPVQTGRVLERVVGRELFYDVTASTLHEMARLGAPMVTLPERDMLHVRGRMLDGQDGYSTMAVGAPTLQTGKAIEEYREHLFGDDGQIRGVFTRDAGLGILPEEAFIRFRAQMRELMLRVAHKNEPVVLEGGIKFERLSVDPSEAELTKQFEAQINNTCRLLRVPPHKVFHLENSKYENLETLDKMYLGDTLVPVCERFERRYERAMLTREDRLTFFIEHDRDEMSLKDTKAETERAVKALERGGITFDEFRARLGYNELPNGQGRMRMIPVNMHVVDEAGNIVIAASAKDEAEKPVEDDADEDKAARTLRLVK